MAEIVQEERIEFLKEAYIEGDLQEDEFERFIEAALEGESPFFKGWFMDKVGEDVRHKRYTEDQVYIYQNVEYVIEGNRVIEAQDKNISRVISVTGNVPDEEDIEVVEDNSDPSKEAREKQEQLRKSFR